MAVFVPFTNNYQDHSTREGYQFEFFCQRCGNGYASSFKHSATGFGGKLLRIGGDLLGGGLGEKAQQVGWDAEYLKDGTRGSTRDKHLSEAVAEVQQYFVQDHACGQWVCRQVCWNEERGMCVQCAPKLDQEVARMQSQAQIQQLNEKIQQTDWTGNVNYRDQGQAICHNCGQETGGGRHQEVLHQLRLRAHQQPEVLRRVRHSSPRHVTGGPVPPHCR
jgi:hypothetical protein